MKPPAENSAPDSDRPESGEPSIIDEDAYFRIRDFEYVQPLYDLAFLLEVDALCKGTEVPKYRTFSLWRAGYSLDGYGTTIDRWLDGTAPEGELDYVPSSRIRQYLLRVRASGTLPELRPYRNARFSRCLRLRSLRGLGPTQIALSASPSTSRDKWLTQVAAAVTVPSKSIADLYDGTSCGPWQTAHVVPPLLRFLKAVEHVLGRPLRWDLAGILDPFIPITQAITVVACDCTDETLLPAVERALKREKLFRRSRTGAPNLISHQLGWCFTIRSSPKSASARYLTEVAEFFDPLSSTAPLTVLGDLHCHTAWSDGAASVNTMAAAITKAGLRYYAVTDHSRSSKLQGGLTPVLWLRQANALTLATPVCPVLHGIEVDIHKDGSLDLPHSLLAAADIVVASVHTSWTTDRRLNTQRLITAIETGHVDVIAHPTSAVIGKPGIPNYLRLPADVDWDAVFAKAAEWRVALEFNCFPSRLDLSLELLRKAISAGCAISIGSDAHARSHLLNLRFGDAALRRLSPPVVLNRLSLNDLKRWIRDSRTARQLLTKSISTFAQGELFVGTDSKQHDIRFTARVQPPQLIPPGSRVVGIDLTAGEKATGVAVLDSFTVETSSVMTDEDIVDYIRQHQPEIVSIDSPLGLPGGGTSIDVKAGIVRVAEYDLGSVGISAYPALIDSMRKLTLRGIGLRRKIESMPQPPKVIESYPGAAQDILCIPRKQKSLLLLREGLRRLGIVGRGLETRSHDEMDAITSAIVGRYFEAGLFEPMGVRSEAQLIVPKASALVFDDAPVICLAGKTGAGKSVVARYLSLFYGFRWIRTRDLIRELLLDDLKAAPDKRIYKRPVDPNSINEQDLREFGAVVLNVHKQAPLRAQLTKTIVERDGPIVVDSIRDVVDVDRQGIGGRPLFIVFIDCPDPVIRHRLAERAKHEKGRLRVASPVDHTAPAIRHEADTIVSNSGSLEELRWRIDDAIFSATRLVVTPDSAHSH